MVFENNMIDNRDPNKTVCTLVSYTSLDNEKVVLETRASSFSIARKREPTNVCWTFKEPPAGMDYGLQQGSVVSLVVDGEVRSNYLTDILYEDDMYTLQEVFQDFKEQKLPALEIEKAADVYIKNLGYEIDPKWFLG